MAERAVVRRIGAAVVSLAALGTAAGPVWAQPQPASRDQTALRAEVAMAAVAGSTRRVAGGLPPTGHRSQPPQRPGTTTRVLPTTAVRGVDLAHPGKALFVGVSQSSLADYTPEPPADYTPVTDTVKGRVGHTVVVRLGVANLGPSLPDGDPGGTFAVVPPAGTTITSIPWEGDDDHRRYSCQPPQDKDNYFFLCDLSEWGVPWPSRSPVTIGFHIRIDKRIPGAKGSITVYGPNDPVPGNNRAVIPVEAAPAPLWRWQHPLWRWQDWALAAGVLALVAPAGRWFVRRRREDGS
ncbi:hypothetical protein [Streptomyces sp. NPDC002205]|uniref:hypothetical protein n=1 Tax=Streptomyces sp. NPDC002205 TaxID=3154411 RepID=UPI0033235507